MKVESIEKWGTARQKPLIIAGPCSVETRDQLFQTVKGLTGSGVQWVRGGVWKPRTRPGNFEGSGIEALKWIEEVKKAFHIKFAVEVATPEHVESALEAGIDLLWIGARTTVNPFNVQEVADALRGVDIPVLIKNPINPDLALWIGAIERFSRVGIQKLGAIHRGFHSLQKTKFRNTPIWQIPIELKSEFPDLPLLCDPSHIAGSRKMIAEISQKALDLNYDGLMIECHPNPAEAWSDAQQQVTPARLQEIIKNLKPRDSAFSDENFINQLEIIREQIDQADREILEAIATRMSLVEKIGEYKQENNVAIFQLSRWKEIFKTRPEWAKALNLDPKFITELYRFIHQQSVKKQTNIFNQEKEQQKR